MQTNIFKIQAHDSIMCRYFFIGFTDHMFASKNLIDYISLFSPNKFKENNKKILSYIKNG